MRTAFAAITGLALLAGTPIGVVAQEEGAKAGLPAAVEGNVTCEIVDRGTPGSSAPAVHRASGVKNQLLDCVGALSDPRVSGDFSLTFNDACFRQDAHYECVAWGTSEGGDTGGWECSYVGTTDPVGDNDVVSLGICSGSGDNEGLAYVYQAAISFQGAGDFGDGTNMKGIIYEGAPPPMTMPSTE